MSHTLMLLEPGHFHAALVLGERHPDLRHEIFVYAPDGPEVRDFLALVEAFTHPPHRPRPAAGGGLGYG